MISLTCVCGKSLRVDDHFAGKVGRCPTCGERLQIPGLPAAVLVEAESQAGASLPQATVQSPPAPAVSADPVAPAVDDPDDPLAGLNQALEQASAARRPAGMVRLAPPQAHRVLFNDSAALGLIAGGMLLANLILPWVTAGDQTVMSWNVLDKAPEPLVFCFIVWWLCGLMAVTLGLGLKGLARQGAYAVLGIMAGLVVMGLVTYGLARIPDSTFPPSAQWSFMMAFVGAVAVTGMVIFTNVRLHAPRRPGVMNAQLVCAALMCLSILYPLFSQMMKLGEPSPAAPMRRQPTPLDSTPFGSQMMFDILFLLLGNVAMLAAGVLGIVDGIGRNRQANAYSRPALWLMYGDMLAMIAYIVIRPATIVGSGDAILPSLHIVMLPTAIFMLLCGGIAGVMVNRITHSQNRIGYT